MLAKIRHLALYTENQDRTATFYQQVFGMKRITRSFNDPNKGHISDGVIGLAVLNRRPGFAAPSITSASRWTTSAASWT